MPLPLPSPQSIEVPKVVGRRESLPTALKKKPKLKIGVSLNMLSPSESKEKKSVTIDTGDTKLSPVDREDTERGTRLPPINLKERSPFKSPLKIPLENL